MHNPLGGQRALITGAASGIGLAAASALKTAGATVIGLDLNDTAGGLEVLRADVTSEDDIARAVALASISCTLFETASMRSPDDMQPAALTTSFIFEPTTRISFDFAFFAGLVLFAI